MATTARAAIGRGSAMGPAPSTSASRMTERRAPETLVRAPARMLSTVPTADAEPGSAPSTPAATLPSPWPASSRFESCRSPVSESCSSEDSRLLMELMSARRNAGWAASTRKPGDSTGGCSAGKPVGKSLSVGASRKPDDGHDGADDQGHQIGRHEPFDPGGPENAHGERHRAHGRRVGVDVRQRVGPRRRRRPPQCRTWAGSGWSRRECRCPTSTPRSRSTACRR